MDELSYEAFAGKAKDLLNGALEMHLAVLEFHEIHGQEPTETVRESVKNMTSQAQAWAILAQAAAIKETSE